MYELFRNRASFRLRPLLLMMSAAALCSVWACGNNAQPSATPSTAQAAPKNFASPDDAGKSLFDAAKSGNQDAVLAIFGPANKGLISTGDAAEDKASLAGFAQAYQVMNRWRKLGDGSELLLVGADNQAFPIPLKSAAGQWYFDAAAGKEELIARRIGRDEIIAIDACAALADAQAQYFAQKHGGVKQYAQKFISDTGQQNGLYWQSPESSARSPLGPLVAFATEEGISLTPDVAKPFYGYYFRWLDGQGAAAKGGAKGYVVNGKATAGFGYVAYPAKFDDTGVQTFIVNQDGLIYAKNLGSDTANLAKVIAQFNPDNTWIAIQ
ncbi:MAG TPA: DUF2950 family protein [Terriglobales bacterium]|jgi:hypothetical protein|nr:DUF2950 family protein [Terriglobales bacterium]